MEIVKKNGSSVDSGVDLKKVDNVREIDIERFRKTGLLWFLNRTLHLFGYVIAVEFDTDDNPIRMFPAETDFRGFSEQQEDRGFKAVTETMRNEIDKMSAALDLSEPSDEKRD